MSQEILNLELIEFIFQIKWFNIYHSVINGFLASVLLTSSPVTDVISGILASQPMKFLKFYFILMTISFFVWNN